MGLALHYPEPTREAGDTPAARANRAYAAAKDTLAQRNALERETAEQILKRLKSLQAALQQRLIGGDGSLTDFRRMNLTALLADTDRLVKQATDDLAAIAQNDYAKADELGQLHAIEPLKAAQLHVIRATPGLSTDLVQAAFGNTVDLLTLPMQQFATDVKVAVRRVTLTGDSRFEEISRLRDKISGAGFDAAQYKAERIIRTEVGRVFNQATYDKLSALTSDFPFLRKGWRASRDSRTRKGHIEAGQKYGRGSGIPIGDLFELNVYDERPGKGVKLIGVARLRFPVDPQTTPQGRIAAGATILCRCNSFVDFNLADFAAFTKARISTALGNTRPPAPTPAPPAPKLPPVPKAPPKPKAVKPVKVALPKAKDVVPTPGPAIDIGPSGPAVSASVQTDFEPRTYVKRMTAGHETKVRAALAEIDKVHGDGVLPTVKAAKMRTKLARGGTLAYYFPPVKELAFGPQIMKTQPMMGVFHETGHFLDHHGLGGGHGYGSENSADLDGWRSAVKNSKAIQSMAKWQAGEGAPQGNIAGTLNYMLSAKETWARSYAQYVAVTSGNAQALKELRIAQKSATVGPVEAGTRYNPSAYGEPKIPGTWELPWQWSDEDFAPIKEAMDELMERKGWRKHRNR